MNCSGIENRRWFILGTVQVADIIFIFIIYMSIFSTLVLRNMNNSKLINCKQTGVTEFWRWNVV